MGDLHASAGLTAEAPSAGRLGAPPARPFDVAAELRRRLAFQAPSASKSQAHGLATLTSVADGNWNNPATWGGSVPTNVDDVIIADGTTVTIDAASTCNNLTVGQGTSGVLIYNATTAVTLTVVGSATISVGGTLSSAATGAITNGLLSIGGNLTNNGTLDLSTNGNAVGDSLKFVGATSNTFGGTGATTDIRTLVISKGASNANILEVNPTNLTVQGVSTGIANFVTLFSGTLKWSGTFSLSSTMFTPAAYSVSTISGLWLNNPNLTIVGQNGSPSVAGLLRVSAGTYNIGTATGNSLGFLSNSTAIVEGGAINATGRFGVATAGNNLTYTQTGGTIMVCTIGNASGALASFDLGQGVAPDPIISGGTIIFQLACTGTTVRDYRNEQGNTGNGITGGTLQFGNASSGAARTFVFIGIAPNVVINNAVAGHTLTTGAPTFFNATTLNITANPTTTFNTGNRVVLMNGTTFTNNGVLVSNGASSRFIWFRANGVETYQGTGTQTGTITSWETQCASVTHNQSNNLVVRRLILFNGDYINSNKLTLGDGSVTANPVQIGNTTTPTAAGSFDVAPTFNLGSGGEAISYLRTTLSRSTGPEVNPARSVVTLTYDDNDVTHALTVAGGDITAATTLALTNGRVVTGTNKVIASGTVTRTTGYVDGNLQKPVATGSPVARTFEVGTSSAYSPVATTFATVTGAGSLVARATNGDHPNIATSGLDASHSVNRYWTMTNSGVAFTTYDAVFTFVPGDLDAGSNTASFITRKFDAPSTWSTTGTGTRTATSTQALGMSSFSDYQVAEVQKWTITASAGAGGTISPSGAVPVPEGSNQVFTITPDGCHTIADVLVDGVSVGAVGTYTFVNVTTTHTISASFNVISYTITASAGANGSIAPSGAVVVDCGSSPSFTISPDPCYHVADVLVDGVSVGAVTSYTFTNVTANHTIAASFAITQYTITSSAGPNGTITPNGATVLNCGDNQTYTIAPASGYYLSDLQVDAVPATPSLSYTFTNVTANHTIAATFALDLATITIGSTATYLCPTNTCVTLPVTLSRLGGTPVLAYSVTFQLSPELTLCSPSSITEGNFLSGSGATLFHVINHGGGLYSVDDALISGCGPSATSGALFSIGVSSASASGPGTLTITSLKLRDCSNGILATAAAPPATVPIDNQAPVVAVTSPNGGELWLAGSSQGITWTATDNTGVANVDLAYSTDGGATYPNVIATGVANSGSYAWTVPGIATTLARVQVTAHDVVCSSSADASDANFTIRNPVITSSAGAGGSISPSGAISVPFGGNQSFTIGADPCNSIADVLVDGVSVGAVSTYTFLNVQADHTIAASFSIGNQTIIATAGAGGTISPSGTVLVPCGSDQTFTISPDGCHHIADVLVDGVSVGAVASYTFTNVQTGHTIAASFAQTVVPVSPVTGLASVQVKTGNDTNGTTKITVSFSAPGAASVEVWRKGYGSYPTYDNGGGSVPTAPGSYPPAGWTLTGVTASGQTDEPASRDVWYYVAFAKDACGNVSPASLLTGGTLDYHLGDVSDGVTPGHGDNSVSTVDVSLLGAHYGQTGGALAGFEYLDVGPTTTTTTDGRPTTDAKVNFEDLVMFALNYTPAVSLVGKLPVTSSVGANRVAAHGPETVAAGEEFDVTIDLSGAGDLQAVSVALAWNAAVAVPVGTTAGGWITDRGGVVLAPAAGSADAALLGATSQGMTGEGVLATVRFRAIAGGSPSIGVGQVIGRDVHNKPVAVAIAASGIPAGPGRSSLTQLQPVLPNPSRGQSTLVYSLAKPGRVGLSIYSVDGRLVKSLARGIQDAGTYRINWDGVDERGSVSKSGVYFVRFEAPGVRQTRVLNLVR